MVDQLLYSWYGCSIALILVWMINYFNRGMDDHLLYSWCVWMINCFILGRDDHLLYSHNQSANFISIL